MSGVELKPGMRAQWLHDLRGCPPGSATVADWVQVREVDGWRVTVELVTPTRPGALGAPFVVDIATLSNYTDGPGAS